MGRSLLSLFFHLKGQPYCLIREGEGKGMEIAVGSWNVDHFLDHSLCSATESSIRPVYGAFLWCTHAHIHPSMIGIQLFLVFIEFKMHYLFIHLVPARQIPFCFTRMTNKGMWIWIPTGKITGCAVQRKVQKKKEVIISWSDDKLINKLNGICKHINKIYIHIDEKDSLNFAALNFMKFSAKQHKQSLELFFASIVWACENVNSSCNIKKNGFCFCL